jgi:hypothetical protein
MWFQNGIQILFFLNIQSLIFENMLSEDFISNKKYMVIIRIASIRINVAIKNVII